MKRVSLRILATAILISALSVLVQAQNVGPSELIANIPFEFQVGNKTLPAGEYRVTCLNPSSDVRVLRIRNADGQGAVVQTSSIIGKLQQDARLVFHRYGNEHYFAQAWFASDGIGLASRKSKREKADELAGKQKRIETVSLVRARN